MGSVAVERGSRQWNIFRSRVLNCLRIESGVRASNATALDVLGSYMNYYGPAQLASVETALRELCCEGSAYRVIRGKDATWYLPTIETE